MTIVNDMIIQAAVRFAIAGASDIINVHHMKVTDAGAGDEDDSIDAFQDSIQTALVYLEDMYSTGMTVVETLYHARVQGLSQPWIPIGIRSGGWAGTMVTDETCPPGVAPLVAFGAYDGLRGARKYLPPPVEGAVSLGVMNSTNTARMLGYAAWLVQPISFGGVTGVPVVIRTATGMTIALTGDITVNAELGYQRRRKPSVGS